MFDDDDDDDGGGGMDVQTDRQIHAEWEEEAQREARQTIITISHSLGRAEEWRGGYGGFSFQLHAQREIGREEGRSDVPHGRPLWGPSFLLSPSHPLVLTYARFAALNIDEKNELSFPG